MPAISSHSAMFLPLSAIREGILQFYVSEAIAIDECRVQQKILPQQHCTVLICNLEPILSQN